MKKNAIRAVPYLAVTGISAMITYSVLAYPMTHANAQSTFENVVYDQVTAEVVGEIYSNSDVEMSTNAYIARADVSEMNREIEVHVLTNTNDVIPTVSMRNRDGNMVQTAPVNVNAEMLMAAYNRPTSSESWDHKNKMRVINCLWHFFVEQQNYNEIIAASIIGAVMYEGRFGEEQGTYRIFSSIDDARRVLGTGERGYGVAQWTYKTRQSRLLEYYEYANDMYPNDWETACIVAECSMLLREIEAYGVFDGVGESATFEDSVGRMSLLYEKYEGCYEQWSSEGGIYRLTSTDGSGLGRLTYAENIYNHFMNN